MNKIINIDKYLKKLYNILEMKYNFLKPIICIQIDIIEKKI